jgi:hypothetical protein
MFVVLSQFERVAVLACKRAAVCVKFWLFEFLVNAVQYNMDATKVMWDNEQTTKLSSVGFHKSIHGIRKQR